MQRTRKRERKENHERTQVTYVQCCSNRLFCWTTRCHVCCSFPPQSTTFSVFHTHIHPRYHTSIPYHTIPHTIAPYILRIHDSIPPYSTVLHIIIYTQHNRTHRPAHNTPSPNDSLSLKSLSCRPFAFRPAFPSPITLPSSREASVPTNGSMVLFYDLVQATQLHVL